MSDLLEDTPVRTRRETIALILVPTLAVLLAGILVLRSLTDSGTALPLAPTDPVTIASPTSGASSPTTATSPATTPVAPAPTTFAGFPTTTCTPAGVASGGGLGIGIPRPTRLSQPGPEATTFQASFACLSAVGGAKPTLRTQLPIDVTRRTTPGDDERAELIAFGKLLTDTGADGIVSIRAHDFARCGQDGAPVASVVAVVPDGQALGTCQFPTIPLYEKLFTEIRDAVKASAPNAQVWFTAWHEPDHPMFTLRSALGEEGAAKRAGEYWRSAAGIAGADRVLAGEFSDRDLPTLLRLRTAFLKGSGGIDPSVWALHPYRASTEAASAGVVEGFSEAVKPSPVWLTEAGPRLSGRGGITGRAQLQHARGVALRKVIATQPVHVILYLLTPPPQPATPVQDDWDSAIADRAGYARPFLCGLAGLPTTDCPGSANAYGG